VDKTIKKSWTSALRSGKFRQCQGTLRRNYLAHAEISSSYCCLGVLCDILQPPGENLWKEEIDSDDKPYWIYRGAVNSLTEDLRNETKLSASDVAYLMKMNDDDRMPFPQIADWIEHNL
jgi:hypothetical protein